MSDSELSDEVREALAQVSVATITSQLLLRGFRNTFLTGVAPIRPDLRMVGEAFTVRYAPSREDRGFQVDYDNDTDVQRLAVEHIDPGSVLVIDARRELRAASFGHILATRLAERGVVGVVTDGALRDSPACRELGFPMYSGGAHATTSSVMHLPVDMQVAIGCADVLIEPGDVIVGDGEGVAAIPRHLVAEIAEGSVEQESRERYSLELVRRGESIRGVYPLDGRRLEDYENWRQQEGIDG